MSKIYYTEWQTERKSGRVRTEKFMRVIVYIRESDREIRILKRERESKRKGREVVVGMMKRTAFDVKVLI